MSSPSLIVLSQLFYPELISTGLTLTELCESLSKKGLQLEVVCAQPSLVNAGERVPKHMTYKGIPIKRLWSTCFPKINTLGKAINHLTFTFSLFFYLLSLPRHSRLLLLTNPPILPLLMRFLQPIKRFNYSVLVFDVYPETLVVAGAFSTNNIFITLWKRINRYVYSHAEHVIVIGRCMKAIIEQYCPSNKEAVTLIPIWCDNSNIESNSKRQFRKEWGLEQTFIAGYSGNMARFHDIETFLSVAKLYQGQPDIHFVFVGEGYKKQMAIDFVKKEGLTNCSFHTYVPREDLGALLNSFDCGLVSLNAENTGLSVPSKSLGLIASGLPIMGLFRNDCEIARLIHEHQLGISCEPGDIQGCYKAIQTLYKNKAQRLNMRNNCLRLSKGSLHLDNIADAYIKLFTK